jgi:hypothetical protein
MRQKLEDAIEKYFRGLIEGHGFRLVDEYASKMGVLKGYESENLFIRIINDKGIISLDIAPKSNPQKMYDIALYKELREPPVRGSWNLSLQEQADYLEDNWVWFNKNLTGEEIDNTLEKLEDCAKNRVKKIFGERATKANTH